MCSSAVDEASGGSWGTGGSRSITPEEQAGACGFAAAVLDVFIFFGRALAARATFLGGLEVFAEALGLAGSAHCSAGSSPILDVASSSLLGAPTGTLGLGACLASAAATLLANFLAPGGALSRRNVLMFLKTPAVVGGVWWALAGKEPHSMLELSLV